MPGPMTRPAISRRRRVKFLAADDHGHTFDYPVQAMQRALAAHGMQHLHNDNALYRFLGRGLSKLGLMRRVVSLTDTAYFVPIMQVTEMRLFPVCYFAEIIPYCFDCWPRKYDQWEAFFRRHKIRLAFITARQSAERMRQRIPNLEAIWMPEAIDPTPYDGSKPLADRTIDILEMGRRYDRYHEAITAHCAAQRYRHEYERRPGELIFPTEADFHRGLGDAKISACFPRCMTHPQNAGDVETMTLRYLESIACKCVTIGRCPPEMTDLFGYEPIINVDSTDPTAQLDEILRNLRAYCDLVERNYKRLIEIGTWEMRINQVAEVMRQNGYGC